MPTLELYGGDRFVPDPYFDTHPSRCDASHYAIFTIADAQRLFRGREIHIWGAGQKGRGFLLALRRCGFDAAGFLDSSPQLKNTEYMGVRVRHPDDVLGEPRASERLFVLTATVDAKNKEMFHILEHKYGFVRGHAYENIQTLSPFYPTIEVTGLCNLKCSSCPRADSEMLPVGKYMNYDTYEKVIRKLVREIPFLYLIDMYIWGEPMLNPDLPDMIRLNNSLGIASGLSTNLNNVRHLEKVMEAFPAQIRVSLSGMTKETYEVTHTGGRWDAVRKNLDTLAALNDLHDRRTIIELYFHLYNHNLGDLQAAADLAHKHGFRLHPSLAILFHDLVLRYAETGQLPPTAKAANERLLISVDQLLSECASQGDRNCILTRIIPVINWDTSVMACCTYTYSDLARSFLDIPLEEIVRRRTRSSTCAACQKHALHRWNDQGKYAGYVEEIVHSRTRGPARV